MTIEKQKFKPPTVRSKKFVELVEILCSPIGFEFTSPSHDDGPLAVVPSTLTFWHYQIKAGLRFPIYHFLSELSTFYSIPLNQLYPSSIRKALFFHIILR